MAASTLMSPAISVQHARQRAFRATVTAFNDLRLIQDYLGHRDPKHTVHYTRTAGRRFDGLWR